MLALVLTLGLFPLMGYAQENGAGPLSEETDVSADNEPLLNSALIEEGFASQSTKEILNISPMAIATLYVDSTAADDSAPRADGALYRTLAGAIAAAQSGDIISLVNTAQVSAVRYIPNSMSLTITSTGNESIVRAPGYTGALFSVQTGGALTLNNVTVDGGAIWSGTSNIGVVGTDRLISSYGDLTLNGGTILRNNDLPSLSGGFIATYGPGTLVVDDASLYGGRAQTAGAMFFANGASGVLRNGSIYQNVATETTGGAFMAFFGSSVTMEAGFKIYDNAALGGTSSTGYGGAAYLQDATFEILGGEIYGNSAGGPRPGYGGAIAMNGGTITLSGGSIHDNFANNWGGALYYGGSAYPDSNFIMTGGTVYDNEAGDSGGAVFAHNQSGSNLRAYTTILGGTITGNTAPGTAARSSQAIYASGVIRLSTDAVVSEAIFLLRSGTSNPVDTAVSLVSGTSSSPNTFLLSTDTNFDIANGRVVVEPGSFTYDGITYSISDAEPYVNLFTHTRKAIITASQSSVASPSGTLVLGLYSISFNLNKPASATSDPVPSAIAPLSANPGEVVMSLSGFPADPTLSGHQFLGWSFDQQGLNPLTDTSMALSNGLILYAQWAAITHTVTFVDWNSTVIDTQQVVEGQGAVAPADPVRAGYVFIGWDTDFSNITGDITVTALYEPAPTPAPDSDPNPDSPGIVEDSDTATLVGAYKGKMLSDTGDGLASMVGAGLALAAAFAAAGACLARIRRKAS